ncbi:hypothetical protein EW146_g1676 [Bondarzewia mesenterica]|uniref:F-box domain-containing protein n=1 Tax=Bondarzewia mesenterica TaxID=1095465 RepID=A0A4S4M5C2_9AGAM|nr:hypothetical protein EW146_g1676 [Bondarzewia mesenterica]
MQDTLAAGIIERALVFALYPSICYAFQLMELTLEAYALITSYVGSRSDLSTLCRVSKGFRIAAERALYNTLQMTNPNSSIYLCTLLAGQPRLSPFVVALTIFTQDVNGNTDPESSSLPPHYWESVARALRKLRRLRFLDIHIDNGSSPSNSWVLNGCTFQLQSFHCDFIWDANLVAFLSTQTDLTDLSIADFNDDTPANLSLTARSLRQAESLPKLSFIECTFTEAIGILAPGRPITHVKSCFSRADLNARRAEMAIFLSNLRLSTASLRSINVADSSYTEEFSLDFLSSLVDAMSPHPKLCYLGTVVLPVDGRERLKFYGQLRRLRALECVELEVSDWVPPPLMPLAQRALASELHLYCPSITTVIFMYEFEPMVMRAVNGLWRVADEEFNPDTLWRDT